LAGAEWNVKTVEPYPDVRSTPSASTPKEHRRHPKVATIFEFHRSRWPRSDPSTLLTQPEEISKAATFLLRRRMSGLAFVLRVDE
jgi:hypothetical protein